MNKYFINITKNLNLKAPVVNRTDDIQSLDDVKKNVLNLNPKKSSTSETIPVTVPKQTVDVHLQHLTNAINHIQQTNCFPDKLKQSKVMIVVARTFD